MNITFNLNESINHLQYTQQLDIWTYLQNKCIEYNNIIIKSYKLMTIWLFLYTLFRFLGKLAILKNKGYIIIPEFKIKNITIWKKEKVNLCFFISDIFLNAIFFRIILIYLQSYF